MSSSETVTHQFTDVGVSNVEVGHFWKGGAHAVATKGVYFDTYSAGSYDVSSTFLSKEDLLHLLKLIEETN